MVARDDDSARASLDPAALEAALRATSAGEVLSYAELARRAGHPRGARWAARWLASLPDGHNLPWHRVLRASGEIAFPAGSASYREQLARLQAEGVVVTRGKVRMQRPRSLDEWVFFGEG
ncbi:MAG: MGMT family protein [Lysobacterales bacterium]